MTDLQEDTAHEKTNPGLSPAPPREDEASSMEKTNPGLVPMAFAPSQGGGRKEPSSTGSFRTSPFPEARREPLPARPSRAKLWILGSLAVLILGGSLGYYLLYPSGEGPAVFKGRAEVPPVLQPYLQKADQGDSSAMRMLGTMYYNGLNVTQDRREGIRWYRKAVAAGSVAARRDLEQLGLPAEEK